MVKNFSQINKIELLAAKTQSRNFFTSATAYRDGNLRYHNQIVLNQILTEGNILAAMDPCQVYVAKLNFYSDDDKLPTSYSFVVAIIVTIIIVIIRKCNNKTRRI